MLSDLIPQPVGPRGVKGSVPATEVAIFHRDDDVDRDENAHHHTLGNQPNQAAPGNHKHEEGFMVGESRIWNGSALPNLNWAFEQGQVLERAQYAELFAVIGTTNNIGGETGTQFRLPDSRGRAIIGAGAGGGLTARALASKGGAETHLLSGGEMPVHAHGIRAFLSSTAGDLRAVRTDGISGGQGASDSEFSFSTVNAGGNVPHNNMQPWIAKNIIIKVR